MGLLAWRGACWSISSTSSTGGGGRSGAASSGGGGRTTVCVCVCVKWIVREYYNNSSGYQCLYTHRVLISYNLYCIVKQLVSNKCWEQNWAWPQPSKQDDLITTSVLDLTFLWWRGRGSWGRRRIVVGVKDGVHIMDLLHELVEWGREGGNEMTRSFFLLHRHIPPLTWSPFILKTASAASPGFWMAALADVTMGAIPSRSNCKKNQ